MQSDNVDAILPGLQENWAEMKRSILQAQEAVTIAVAQQIQGAQLVITEAVGADANRKSYVHALQQQHARTCSG